MKGKVIIMKNIKNLFVHEPERTGYEPKTTVITTINDAKLQAYAEVGITDIEAAAKADQVIGQGIKLSAATIIITLPVAAAAAVVETVKANAAGKAAIKTNKNINKNSAYNASYADAFNSAEAQTIYDEKYNKLKFDKNGNVRKNFNHNCAHMSALKSKMAYAKKVATMMSKATK